MNRFIAFKKYLLPVDVFNSTTISMMLLMFHFGPFDAFFISLLDSIENNSKLVFQMSGEGGNPSGIV